MIRFGYFIFFNLLGTVLTLLVGGILLIFSVSLDLTIPVIIGVGILVYTVFLIAGIVCAIVDPLKLDD